MEEVYVCIIFCKGLHNFRFYIFRRNDILMPTAKPSIARQSSDFEVEETKNKKFATAIVEYGKVCVCSSHILGKADLSNRFYCNARLR